MLGFERALRQTRPDPYVVVVKDDIELHFFGVDDLDPEDTHGTCIVIVPDTGELFDTFAAGMRAEHGRLLLSGIPRTTRPRKRANTGNRAGFSVTDPGGNVIRFFPSGEDAEAETSAESRLGKTLGKAVVLGESKGDASQAARILDATLARAADAATKYEPVEALAYRAELAVRQDDRTGARELLDRLDATALTGEERERLTATLADAEELRRQLG